MFEEGLLGETQTNLGIGVVIAIEVIFVIYQIFKYLENHEDKNRQRYLFLILPLLVQNMIPELVTQTGFNIPTFVQYLLYYSRGPVIAVCYALYFYKLFGISVLKFHVNRSIGLFLLACYPLVSIGCHALTNDIKRSILLGMISPLIYICILIPTIGKALHKRHKDGQDSDSEGAWLIFLTVLIWEAVAFISIRGIGREQEFFLTNIGFLIVCLFYARKEFREARENRLIRRILIEKGIDIPQLHHLFKVVPNASNVKVESDAELDFFDPEMITENTPETEFDDPILEENCKKYNLSEIEIEVITMVSQNLTYKNIAKHRGVSEDYIKEIMGNIGKRLNINKKENILQKLKHKSQNK